MNNAINVLNALIEIIDGRIAGYDSAIAATDEAELKTLFSQLKFTSQKCKTELAIEVQKKGGQPGESTSINGRFTTATIKASVANMGKDREAIYHFCNQCIDGIAAAYNQIIADDFEELSYEQQGMVTVQRALIKVDKQKIDSLHHRPFEHR